MNVRYKTISTLPPSIIMSTLKISKKIQKSRDPGIQDGDLILFKLPNNDVKSVKIEQNM